MQKAIQILDDMIKEYPLHSSQDALLDAKSRIQALGDGWIPVSEKPKKDGTYLVYGDPEDSEIYDYFLNGRWNNMNPTHWMPLPLPPQ